MEVEESGPALIDPPARSYVEPWVVVASSASAVSARLFTHPREHFRYSGHTAIRSADLFELQSTPSGYEFRPQGTPFRRYENSFPHLD
jgi:hypothetical protein